MYYNGIDNSPMLLLLLYDSQWKLSVFASWVQGDARAKWDPETVEKFDKKSLLNLILFSQTALLLSAFSSPSARCEVVSFWKREKFKLFGLVLGEQCEKSFHFSPTSKLLKSERVESWITCSFVLQVERIEIVLRHDVLEERERRGLHGKTLTIYFHGNMFREGRAENVEHAHLNTTFLTLLLCSIVRDCREDFSC